MYILKLFACKCSSAGHWNKLASSFLLVSEEQEENDDPGKAEANGHIRDICTDFLK